MSGTWPTARAEIKAQLDGLTFTAGPDFATETLRAFEWPPPGRQDAIGYPYAYVSMVQTVRREPGSQRITSGDPVVRVMLATPADGNSSMEVLRQRYDAIVEAMKDAFDDAVALDGNADIFLDQVFTDIEPFNDTDIGWGFEMTLEGLEISETKEFGV